MEVAHDPPSAPSDSGEQAQAESNSTKGASHETAEEAKPDEKGSTALQGPEAGLGSLVETNMDALQVEPPATPRPTPTPVRSDVVSVHNMSSEAEAGKTETKESGQEAVPNPEIQTEAPHRTLRKYLKNARQVRLAGLQEVKAAEKAALPPLLPTDWQNMPCLEADMQKPPQKRGRKPKVKEETTDVPEASAKAKAKAKARARAEAKEEKERGPKSLSKSTEQAKEKQDEMKEPPAATRKKNEKQTDKMPEDEPANTATKKRKEKGEEKQEERKSESKEPRVKAASKRKAKEMSNQDAPIPEPACEKSVRKSEDAVMSKVPEATRKRKGAKQEPADHYAAALAAEWEKVSKVWKGQGPPEPKVNVRACKKAKVYVPIDMSGDVSPSSAYAAACAAVDVERLSAKRSEEPKEPAEPAETAESPKAPANPTELAENQASEAKKGRSAEQKAKLSRKSAAYVKARNQKLKEGATDDVAKAAGKKALTYHCF